MSQHNWPTGALRRVLDNQFDGAKDANEAVSKLIKSKHSESPAGISVKEKSPDSKMSDVEALRWAINEIERRLNGREIDPQRKIDLETMPLLTREDLRLWTLAWFSEIEKLK